MLRGAFVDFLDVKSCERDPAIVVVVIPSLRSPQRALAGEGEGAGTRDECSLTLRWRDHYRVDGLHLGQILEPVHPSVLVLSDLRLGGNLGEHG